MLNRSELPHPGYPGRGGYGWVSDVKLSQLHDAPERPAPPRNFLVLGGNRDRTADSRVLPALFGVGMVPVDAVIGRPPRAYSSTNHGRFGTWLGR